MRVDVPDVENYKSLLEEFIGMDRVERCLERLERSLKHAGPIYRDNWVVPNNRLWMGLGQLRRLFAHGRPSKVVLADEAIWALEISVKLRDLTPTMPQATRNEFAHRLAGKGFTVPILFELHVASHFWQAGYEIEWSDTVDPNARSAPEFTAVGHGCRVEVECKAPPVDWGQMVTRPEFYRVADGLVAWLRRRDLYGDIVVEVQDRIPTSESWHKEVAKAVATAAATSGSTDLSDGGRATWVLCRGGAVVIPQRAFDSKIAGMRSVSFSHVAVAADPVKGGVRAPIVIHARSNAPDPVADDLLELLRAAGHKFSGSTTATICCFLPEVEDLTAMSVRSALGVVTERYFNGHGNAHLRDIRFFGRPRLVEGPLVISTEFPTVTYLSPGWGQRPSRGGST